MPYKKSYSNYVIKKKHQNVDDGVIFERDYSTLGGVNRFPSDRIPTYQHGNFVFTVNNEKDNSHEFNQNEWVENKDGFNWNASVLKDYISKVKKDQKFELKLNSNRIQDFAYYGSCVELVRASLNDIYTKFPGELYCNEDSQSFIYCQDTTDGEYNLENGTYPIKRICGNDNELTIDNPFAIDIHSNFVNEEDITNKLRYFANDGFKNFVIFKGEAPKEEDEEKYEIKNYHFNQTSDCTPIGGKIGETTIIYKDGSLVVSVYRGENGSVVYNVPQSAKELHIRPKKRFYEEFFETLDNFEKVILNKYSTPKYKAVFEVMKEVEYGYRVEMRNFIFPTTLGDYNLAYNNNNYDSYLNNLSDLASFYDELFCDNIYRSMTHESIKNFDWTYEIKKQGEDADILYGATKMQKVLRLIGREFDEIKSYIDGIGNSNTITYSDSDNLPNYFLSDALEAIGVDVINIYPLHMEEYGPDSSDSRYDTPITSKVTAEDRKKNKTSNGDYIRRVFGEDKNVTVSPFNEDYILYKNGYYRGCECGGDCKPSCDRTINKVKTPTRISVNGQIRQVFKPYSSSKEYKASDVNNEFLKYFKINTPFILNKKGTIHGVESLLSLFGLKSKKFYETSKRFKCTEDKTNHKYDYDIEEYVVNTEGIIDNWSAEYDMNKFNFYNYTKSYSYDTEEFRNGIYKSYRGLPVMQLISGSDLNRNNQTSFFDNEKEYEFEEIPLGVNIEGLDRKLYPYFDKKKQYDGNLYYQTKGSWLKKTPFQFTKDNDINMGLHRHTETLKDIRTVDSIIDLMNIPYNELDDKQIVKVENTNQDYVIIDGKPYEILQETNIETNNTRYYISEFVKDGTLTIGYVTFDEFVYVSDSYGFLEDMKNINEPRVYKHILSEYQNGEQIKIYLCGPNKDKIMCYNNDNTIFDVRFFKDGAIVGSNIKEDRNMSKYFRINDKAFKNEFSMDGWEQLSNDSDECIFLSTIKDKKKGNNPHLGHTMYDNGWEYIVKFKKLFNSAIKDNAFDSRCYTNITDFNSAMLEVEDFGFQIKIDVNTCDNEYGISKSNKVMSLVGAKDSTKELKIINTKRAKLTFYLHSISGSKDILSSPQAIEECKYLDNIVLHYLEQVIPSNLILEIEYKPSMS